MNGRTSGSTRPAPRRAWALVPILLALACQASPPSASPPPASTPAVRRAASAIDAPICVETDAHAKHRTMGYGCGTCHACGGTLLLCGFTFPGGTTTADMQVVKDGSGTTCAGGCHGPLGVAPAPVAWDHGPLGCTDCHAGFAPGPGLVRSSHVVGGACDGCHDQAQHTSGQVRLRSGDGTSVSSACIACHAGRGMTLAGETPPVLVGWTDAANGDFHGARLGTCRIDRYWYTSGTRKYYRTEMNQPCGSAGPDDVNVVPTGFGGTLRSPYVRGQGPLACEACHEPHASPNAFLLATTVNGTAVPPGAIDRAGVGAQALCTACHEGDRHAYCKSCHRAAMVTDAEGYTYFDPASPPADPMPDGSPCFACHGHEGLQLMQVAAPAYPPSHPYGGGDCTHCHGGWWPGAPEYAAPRIAQGRWSYVPNAYEQASTYPRQPSPPVWLVPGGTVFGVTQTSASIYWETNERATTVVEYGVGTAGQVIAYTPFVAGAVDPANPSGYYMAHRVDLTGLSPNTSYVWRVRTTDAFRNVTHTALGSFRTEDPSGPPAPVLVHEPDQYNAGGSGNEPFVAWQGQPLAWQPVTAPSGGDVRYRLQLSTDPTFGRSEVDVLTADASYPLALSGPLASWVTWTWRVMAIDGNTGLTSSWSDVDAFLVGVGDPYNDY